VPILSTVPPPLAFTSENATDGGKVDGIGKESPDHPTVKDSEDALSQVGRNWSQPSAREGRSHVSIG
jgi:hypothetical protein